MRPQKGKIISWLIFILLIMIAFGMLLTYQKIRETTEETTTPAGTEEEVKVPERKPPTSFVAPEVPEEEKEIADNEAFNRALISGQGCDDIEFDEALKQTCLDTFNYTDALRKNDERLCNKIADEALKTKCLDSIYLSLAKKNADSDLCKKIKDVSLKQNCNDHLLALSSRTAASKETCETIQDSHLKQMCLDNYFFASSIDSLNEESCENIQDIDLKERCGKTIVKNIEIVKVVKSQSIRTYAFSELQLESCDESSGENAVICKDNANFNLAFEKKDLSYCNAIANSERQAQCIQTQTAAINNFYLRQATSLKDPSLCGKILDEGLSITCLQYAQ